MPSQGTTPPIATYGFLYTPRPICILVGEWIILRTTASSTYCFMLHFFRFMFMITESIDKILGCSQYATAVHPIPRWCPLCVSAEQETFYLNTVFFFPLEDSFNSNSSQCFASNGKSSVIIYDTWCRDFFFVSYDDVLRGPCAGFGVPIAATHYEVSRNMTFISLCERHTSSCDNTFAFTHLDTRRRVKLLPVTSL
jgi:hypothetical protein